jgi:hypothetical protein
MHERTRLFVYAVAALAVLGLAGNAQAALIDLGNPSNPPSDPLPSGLFGDRFVPEGSTVELIPTGGGSSLWLRVITGSGTGGPLGTALVSGRNGLAVDDLDLLDNDQGGTENPSKVDLEEWLQMEVYADAAATIPATLQIDFSFSDFTGTGTGDTATATTFGTDGSTVVNGSHRFNRDDGTSSGNGVFYYKNTGDRVPPTPRKEYVEFANPAHIYRFVNDPTSGNGWRLRMIDPGDYVVVPEPASIALLGLGLLATCTLRRRLI